MSDQIGLQTVIGQVAAAYFNNNHVTPAEIPTVISSIANSIAAVGAPTEVEAPPEEPELPKVTSSQIRRSITQDKLISFEDGKGYKTLRRHLAVKGLTPNDYRSKWGLPKDYPMVAPGYSEARSSLAKAAGFGRPAAAATTAPAPAAAPTGAPRSGAAKRAAKGNGKARGPGRPAKARAASEPAT